MEEIAEATDQQSNTGHPHMLLCVLGAALLLAADWCMNLAEVPEPAAQGALGATLLRPAMAASYILCAVFALRAQGFAHKAPFRAVLLAVLLAGHLLFTYAPLLPAAHMARMLGAVLYGVGFAYLLLYWIAQFCSLSPHSIATAFPAVYFVVALVYFVLSSLSPGIATAAVALLPFGSGICFVASVHRAPQGADNARASHPAQGWKFPFYPVALMVVFKFVFYFSLAFTSGASMYGPLGMLVISGFALAGAAFFYEGFQLGFLYKIALPCMVAGLLVVSWVHLGNNAATMVSNAGNIAFELFILITLAEACRRFSVDPFWLFGTVEAAAALCGTAGLYAGRAFSTAYPVGSLEANAVTMTMVVLLVGLSAFLFNERISARSFADSNTGGRTAQESPANDTAASLDLRCAMVARQYNLSRREEEILELIAQGMSVARIEEELFISRSTVKTHVQHIYEKLGVHSREEAIRLVAQG